MAPVIAASQRADLWTELGASYRKFWNIYGMAGSDSGLFYTEQHGQNCLGIEERPRGTKKHTAPLGGQRALAILYQGSH